MSLRKNPDNVSLVQLERMNAYWPDGWRNTLYQKPPGLLPGFDDLEEKVSNEDVAAAYRKRLREVAGFKYVPEPIPMRNSRGAIVYYLFFASSNKTGPEIVADIFGNYRGRGAS